MSIQETQTGVIVVSKETIQAIFSPRLGPNLILLDHVIENKDGSFMGEFTVTEGSCGGHHVLGDQPIFPGFLWPEMANQFLGAVLSVSVSYQKLWGKACLFRERGEFDGGDSRCKGGPVFPGDIVSITMDQELELNSKGPFLVVTGSNFVVTISGRKVPVVATIAHTTLYLYEINPQPQG